MGRDASRVEVAVDIRDPAAVDAARCVAGHAGRGVRGSDEAVPLGRMTRPDEIAGTVAWLLSEDAATITGQGVDRNAGVWMG